MHLERVFEIPDWDGPMDPEDLFYIQHAFFAAHRGPAAVTRLVQRYPVAPEIVCSTLLMLHDDPSLAGLRFFPYRACLPLITGYKGCFESLCASRPSLFANLLHRASSSFYSSNSSPLFSADFGSPRPLDILEALLSFPCSPSYLEDPLHWGLSQNSRHPLVINLFDERFFSFLLSSDIDVTDTTGNAARLSANSVAPSSYSRSHSTASSFSSSGSSDSTLVDHSTPYSPSSQQSILSVLPCFLAAPLSTPSLTADRLSALVPEAASRSAASRVSSAGLALFLDTLSVSLTAVLRHPPIKALFMRLVSCVTSSQDRHKLRFDPRTNISNEQAYNLSLLVLRLGSGAFSPKFYSRIGSSLFPTFCFFQTARLLSGSVFVGAGSASVQERLTAEASVIRQDAKLLSRYIDFVCGVAESQAGSVYRKLYDACLGRNSLPGVPAGVGGRGDVTSDPSLRVAAVAAADGASPGTDSVSGGVIGLSISDGDSGTSALALTSAASENRTGSLLSSRDQRVPEDRFASQSSNQAGNSPASEVALYGSRATQASSEPELTDSDSGPAADSILGLLDERVELVELSLEDKMAQNLSELLHDTAIVDAVLSTERHLVRTPPPCVCNFVSRLLLFANPHRSRCLEVFLGWQARNTALCAVTVRRLARLYPSALPADRVLISRLLQDAETPVDRGTLRMAHELLAEIEEHVTGALAAAKRVARLRALGEKYSRESSRDEGDGSSSTRSSRLRSRADGTTRDRDGGGSRDRSEVNDTYDEDRAPVIDSRSSSSVASTDISPSETRRGTQRSGASSGDIPLSYSSAEEEQPNMSNEENSGVGRSEISNGSNDDTHDAPNHHNNHIHHNITNDQSHEGISDSSESSDTLTGSSDSTDDFSVPEPILRRIRNMSREEVLEHVQSANPSGSATEIRTIAEHLRERAEMLDAPPSRALSDSERSVRRSLSLLRRLVPERERMEAEEYLSEHVLFLALNWSRRNRRLFLNRAVFQRLCRVSECVLSELLADNAESERRKAESRRKDDKKSKGQRGDQRALGDFKALVLRQVLKTVSNVLSGAPVLAKKAVLSSKVLISATRMAEDHQIISGVFVESLAEIGQWIREAEDARALECAEDENGLVDENVPEEFLDPLTFIVMEHPVRLLTSRTTIDRSTFNQIMLNDQTDPFSRLPIDESKIEEDVELRDAITAWKQSQSKK